MNPQTRRKRQILRSARCGPHGKKIRTVPIYDASGGILHYTIVQDPWFTCRRGYPRRDSPENSKSRQQWIKEYDLFARQDMDHALSDCCGWGNVEPYHDPVVYRGSIVPARNRPYPPEKHQE